MDFDLLNWFRSFNFIKFFNVTVHKMKFRNKQWNKDAITESLNEDFRTIKCCICGENSQWIITFLKLKCLFKISYI